MSRKKLTFVAMGTARMADTEVVIVAVPLSDIEEEFPGLTPVQVFFTNPDALDVAEAEVASIVAAAANNHNKEN